MSEVRYMANKGFEAAERQMLNQISNYAREGWLLKSMTPARFEFERSAPRDLQYVMEYLPELTNRKSYVESIKRRGWDYVCECEGYRIFSAPLGTRELSVDRSYLYRIIAKKNKKMLFMLFISILIFALTWFSSLNGDIKLGCAVGCAILFGYSAAGLVGLRKKKENK